MPRNAHNPSKKPSRSQTVIWQAKRLLLNDDMKGVVLLLRSYAKRKGNIRWAAPYAALSWLLRNCDQRHASQLSYILDEFMPFDHPLFVKKLRREQLGMYRRFKDFSGMKRAELALVNLPSS